MNRKHWLTTIVVAAILLFAYFVFSKPKDETFAITTTVLKGPFEILVYSTGQLESENSDNILIPEKMKDRQTRISRLTITDLVEEGTYVDSGAYVATLDHQEVEEQLKGAMDELEKTFSEYNDSKIDSNLTLSNQRDLIVNASLDLEEKDLVVQESVYESPSLQRKAEMDLDKASRKLEQTKTAYKLKTQQETNKVNRTFINYKQVRERVNALEELISTLIIYSPRSGIISYFQYPYGGSTKTGSRVSQWNPIIATFPNMDSLITKTFINEIDISLIKSGQKVKIGIDAFPNKELSGEVTSIANMGQIMPKSDAKVFEVKIKINGSDPDLRPAMTTSNTIQINSFEDVLYIPIESVYKNDSLSYVFPTEGKDIKQVIETGDENENFVIVLQGLTEGQKLYSLEPENAESRPISGMEIFEEIKHKKEEKRVKEEENKRKQIEQKSKEQLPGMQISGVNTLTKTLN
ncbi:MAG: HlyD family efflux transporter periplasmic adaptor subunit [Draconibacterium sp.]|nr:HlyD family efflux transporter periplasmic adaptor subunit [Draconibacterium sp.]